jgi:hypothetical protein
MESIPWEGEDISPVKGQNSHIFDNSTHKRLLRCVSFGLILDFGCCFI